MQLSIINDTAAYCDGKGIWYNFWEKEMAWLIVIAYAIFTAFMLFKLSIQAKKKASGSRSKISIAFGVLFLGYACARILFIFSDIERWNNCETIRFAQFVLFSYTVGIFSAIMLLRCIERDVLGMKKGILSNFYIAFAIFALILAVFASIIVEHLNSIRLMNTIISSAGAGLLMILYFRMIMISTGVLKRQAELTLVGVVTVFIGSILDSELLIQQLNIPIWIPTIFPLIGFSIILYIQNLMAKSMESTV